MQSEITLQIGDTTITKPVADLTWSERNQLFNIMGMEAFRESLFSAWEDRPRFKKLTVRDGMDACPRGEWFHISFSKKTIDEPEPIPHLLGDFKAQIQIHTASGYCKCCKTQHTVTKTGVLISTVVGGTPFSREYLFDEEEESYEI